MPLKLRPPRKGRTPNYEIRGTYLGCHVEISSGTHKRSLALKQLRTIEECIEEHGQYPAPEPAPRTGEPTFLSAAVAYMQAGGRRKYVAPLIKHFGETLLTDMTQKPIDDAAAELHPNVTPATRNGYVYTPVSAIMHHALGEKCPVIRRPKDAKGRIKTDFMWPAVAFSVVEAADAIDAEFGLYLRLLIYTGIRKSEGLGTLSADVQPQERAAWLRDSKNEDPRMLKLREDIVGPQQAHLEANSGERLFRFNDGGHFKHLLLRAKLNACGLPCPGAPPDRMEATGPPSLVRWLPHLPTHLGDVDAPLWRRRCPGARRNRQLARPKERRPLCSCGLAGRVGSRGRPAQQHGEYTGKSSQ